jgi:hypothetical protein
MTRLNILGWIN